MSKNLLSSILSEKNKALVVFLFLLTGCQSTSKTQNSLVDTTPSGSVATEAAQDITSQSVNKEKNSYSSAYYVTNPDEKKDNKNKEESVKLQECMSQLDALKIMNPAKYSQIRITFDHLMQSASQYASLRSKINFDTQSTVDDLYRYRSRLLCAQIGKMLLDDLIQRGESRP